MNLFCRLLGHTWVDQFLTPKTTWNVDKAGVVLVARMTGRPERFQQCVRCKQRRDLPPPGSREE